MAQLSALLGRAAEMLAAEIEAGEFDALDQERKVRLRMLSLSLAGWSDRAASERRDHDALPGLMVASKAGERARSRARTGARLLVAGTAMAIVTVALGVLRLAGIG